jgi:hypothetical protein
MGLMPTFSAAAAALKTTPNSQVFAQELLRATVRRPYVDDFKPMRDHVFADTEVGVRSCLQAGFKSQMRFPLVALGGLPWEGPVSSYI